MKALITKKLLVFVVTIWAILLSSNTYFQYNESIHEQATTSLSTIKQIEDILTTNKESLETLTESLK